MASQPLRVELRSTGPAGKHCHVALDEKSLDGHVRSMVITADVNSAIVVTLELVNVTVDADLQVTLDNLRLIPRK